MGTIDNEYTVARLIKNKGKYEDDPQLFGIVQYTNAWDGECWGLAYSERSFQGYTQPTEYVRDPRILWTVAGVTKFGLEFMQRFAKANGHPIPETKEDVYD